jgi:hypothetical protein
MSLAKSVKQSALIDGCQAHIDMKPLGVSAEIDMDFRFDSRLYRDGALFLYVCHAALWHWNRGTASI